MNRTQVFDRIFGKEFCEYVEQVGETYSRTCWNIANIVGDARTILAEMKSAIVRGDLDKSMTNKQANAILAYGTMDLYNQLAMRLGINIRTLRDYYSVGTFYSEAQIDKYDALPFSHFRFAKQCGSDLADRILFLSLRAMDYNGGRPPSVNWLEVNLWRVANDKVILDDLETVLNFMDSASDVLPSDVNVNDDEKLPSIIYLFVTSARELVKGLNSRLSDMRLDGDRSNRIFEIIELLMELTDEILATVDE